MKYNYILVAVFCALIVNFIAICYFLFVGLDIAIFGLERKICGKV